jgi:hypothetical protein
MRWALCALLFSAWAAAASAHKPSDSYLRLTRADDTVAGHWDIALDDLDYALGLDRDATNTLTWRDVRESAPQIVRYAFEHLALRGAGLACVQRDEPAAVARALALVQHSDGPYVRLNLAFRCLDAASLTLHYSLLFELDAQHRAVVQVGEQTSVLRSAQRSLMLGANSERTFGALVREGVAHIFQGVDHLLFLVALLLPALLGGAFASRSNTENRKALLDVAKVVTSFTAAHSLTLALSALGLVSMASTVIEPAIACTVAIAAAGNLRKRVAHGRALVAFVLGLLHGFGFSSALSDLGLSGAGLLRALLAFNAGVELGQLAVVLALLPLAWLLRRSLRGSEWLLRGGSLAIVAIALSWMFERI